MSLTPEAQRKVIDYYFQEPNAKAVLEDGLGSNRQDVVDFLKAIYDHLVATLWTGVAIRRVGDVGIGISATTADMKVLYGPKAPGS